MTGFLDPLQFQPPELQPKLVKRPMTLGFCTCTAPGTGHHSQNVHFNHFSASFLYPTAFYTISRTSPFALLHEHVLLYFSTPYFF